MSHTPGPWCVDEVKALGAYGVWTDYPTHPGHDGAGYPSQVCSVITDCFPLPGKNRDERTANARLIAAAPALLAACEAILAELHRAGEWCGGNPDHAALESAIKLARTPAR